MDKELRSRIGKFKIDLQAVALWDDELLFRIMSHCVVIKTECNYIDPVIEYTAHSPLFDTVEEGNIPPTYLWKYDSVADALTVIHESSLMDNLQFELKKARTALQHKSNYINTARVELDEFRKEVKELRTERDGLRQRLIMQAKL